MSNYLQSPPCPPWKIDGGQVYVSADVDGDGKDEIVALDPRTATLGLLSYFTYGQLASEWEGQGASRLMTWWQGRPDASAEYALTADTKLFAGDLDGDGREELLLFDTTALTLNVIRWDGSKFASVTGGAVAPENWTVRTDDQIYLAPLTAGRTNLILYNQKAFMLAVYELVGTALTQLYLCTDTLGPLPLALGLQFYFPKLYTAAQSTLAVFFPSDYKNEGALYLFDWDGSAFEPGLSYGATNSGLPDWQISSTDRLFFGDVYGDGRDEMLVYRDPAAPDGNRLGFFGFDAVQGFTNLWQSAGNVNDWPLSAADQFWVKRMYGAQMLAFQPSEPSMGVFGWNNVNAWEGGVSPLPSPYVFNGDDTFVYGDFNGDGYLEIFVYKQAGDWLEIFGWNLGSFITLSAVKSWVPGWGVALFSEAPDTPLTPFSGVEANIYQYISNQLEPMSQGDIRAEYTALDAPPGGFPAYYEKLSGDELKSPPQGESWTQDEWDAVRAPLLVELDSVGFVRTFFKNLRQLASDIETQKDNALKDAVGFINLTPEDKAGEVVKELIDIMNVFAMALPMFGEVAGPAAIAMGLGASLLTLGFDGSGGDSGQLDYETFKSKLDAGYAVLDTLRELLEYKVIENRHSLPLVAQLSDLGPWAFTLFDDKDAPSTFDKDVNDNTYKAHKLFFYQALIPLRFAVFTVLSRFSSGELNPRYPANLIYVDNLGNDQYQYYTLNRIDEPQSCAPASSQLGGDLIDLGQAVFGKDDGPQMVTNMLLQRDGWGGFKVQVGSSDT